MLHAFAAREGFSDPGEERALAAVAEAARGRPILDLGVGGGRTVPLLQPLGSDYVAVDYMPEMVQLARSRHPGARVEQGDARDLAGFGEGAFGLVVFSLNGIDGLPHEDRARIFAAVRRVLAPGGMFLYSTHNLEHRLAGQPPWSRRRLPGRVAARPLAGWALRLPRRSRNYLRLRGLTARGEDWAILVGASYEHGVVGHYTTLEAALAEPGRHGFEPAVRAWGSSGRELTAGSDAGDSEWFHLLAHNPAG